MQPHEIQRALRLITSTQFKRDRRFPIAVLARLSGLSRAILYEARAGRYLTPRVIASLTPLLTAIIAGALRVERRERTWRVSTVGQLEMYPSQFSER